MAVISKRTLNEIQLEAKQYLLSLKGNELTEEDVVAAENLIVFGYCRAMEDFGIKPDKQEFRTYSPPIINSKLDLVKISEGNHCEK